MLITTQELVERRRHFYTAAFIAGAVIAPPEVLSQMAVAIPLILFYEAIVAVVRWSENGQ